MSAGISLQQLRGNDEIIRQITRAKKVIAIVGAGISTSTGIPDFRGAKGIYQVSNMENLFHADYVFSPDYPQHFVEFIRFIGHLTDTVRKAEPSVTHRMLKLLQDQGRLLRVYSQNIDFLEDRVGLKVGLEKGDSTILLHGTLGYVICSVWNHLKIPVTHEVIQEFSEGRKVPCPVCQANALAASARQSRERKVGVLRPAIVLYEELIPDGEIIIERSVSDAKARPTLLIVMGTSLSVKEIRKLVGDFRKAVKKENGLVLFVNLKTVEASLMAQFDHWISADADSFSEFVMEILQVRPSPVESLVVPTAVMSDKQDNDDTKKQLELLSAAVKLLSEQVEKLQRQNEELALANMEYHRRLAEQEEGSAEASVKRPKFHGEPFFHRDTIASSPTSAVSRTPAATFNPPFAPFTPFTPVSTTQRQLAVTKPVGSVRPPYFSPGPQQPDAGITSYSYRGYSDPRAGNVVLRSYAPGIRPLKNYGSTCYYNAALQAFFGLKAGMTIIMGQLLTFPASREYVQKKDRHGKSLEQILGYSFMEFETGQRDFLAAYQAICEDVRFDEQAVNRSIDILRKFIQSKRPRQFPDSHEHDSSEMFQALLNIAGNISCGSEVGLYNNSKNYIFCHGMFVEKKLSSDDFINLIGHMRPLGRLNIDLFGTITRTRYECKSPRHHRWETLEIMTSNTIPLIPGLEETEVESVLAEFYTERNERTPDEHRCSLCDKEGIAQAGVFSEAKILLLPRYQVFIVNRFQNVVSARGRVTQNKDNGKVNFPDLLNMRPYVSREENLPRYVIHPEKVPVDVGEADLGLYKGVNQTFNYEPRVVVCHQGPDMSSGHYVTFVRKPESWYLFDDDRPPIKLSGKPPIEDAYYVIYEHVDGR